MPAVLTRSSTAGAFSALSSSHAVLVLGWAGSNDKMLSKYSAIYEQKGLDTLRFTARLKTASSRGLAGMRDMTELLPHLEGLLGHRRLVMHVMSMNGVYSLCSLLLNDRYKDILQKTDAIVWDSCPITSSKIHDALVYGTVYDAVHRAELESATSLAQRLKYYSARNMAMYLAMKQAIEDRWHVFRGGSIADVSAYHFLRDHPDLPLRQVCIFSDSDSLCPPETIAEFHKFLVEQRGLLATSFRFKDSPHVEHWRKYPREYEVAVDEILGHVQRERGPKAKL